LFLGPTVLTNFDMPPASGYTCTRVVAADYPSTFKLTTRELYKVLSWLLTK
jgi:hypothetical protein